MLHRLPCLNERHPDTWNFTIGVCFFPLLFPLLLLLFPDRLPLLLLLLFPDLLPLPPSSPSGLAPASPSSPFASAAALAAASAPSPSPSTTPPPPLPPPAAPSPHQPPPQTAYGVLLGLGWTRLMRLVHWQCRLRGPSSGSVVISACHLLLRETMASRVSIAGKLQNWWDL